MKKELTELSDLKALEVSLVDAGANKKKRFPITKQEMVEMDEILKAVLDTEVEEETKLGDWLEKAKLSDKGQAAVKSALRILAAYKDELPGDAMKELAKAAGYEEPEKAEKKAFPPEDKKKETEEEEDMDKKKIKKEADDKALEVDVILKAQNDKIAELTTEKDRILKELKTERDLREQAEWIDKAEKELSHYPGKSSKDLGVMLKNLADKDPEFAKQQFEVFKTASDAFKDSGILKERGTYGNIEVGGAWDKIQKLAKGLIEKSSDTKMTIEKAVSLVAEREPELYREYLAENQDRR